MPPKKRARVEETFKTIALKSTCQVSKLIRSLDHTELSEATGTDLSLGTLKNKMSQILHEPDNVQTPYGTLVQQMKVATS